MDIPYEFAVLKSGGPVMRITATEGDLHICEWFDVEGHRHADIFSRVCLTPIYGGPLPCEHIMRRKPE